MVRDERVCASALLPQGAVVKAAASACLVCSSVYWHGMGWNQTSNRKTADLSLEH